jgi:hypothetical protein
MSSEGPVVCPQCGSIPTQAGEESLTPAERFLRHAEQVHGVGVKEARKLASREARTEAEMPAVADDDEPTTPFAKRG